MLSDALSSPITPYIVFVVLAYLGFAGLVVRRYVRPFALMVLVALALMAGVIIELNFVTWWGDERMTAFWKWFRSVHGEYNLLATFSTVLLLSVTGAAFTLALWGQPGRFPTWRARLYWLWIALVFAGLSYDEYYQWHETRRDIWEIIYGAVGVGVLVSSALVYRYGLHHERKLPLFVFILGGIGMLAAGGMLFEKNAVDRLFIPREWTVFYRSLPYLEELLEMLGVSLTLAALLSLLADQVPLRHRTYARMTFLASAGTLVIGVLASFWVVPRIEASWRATTVNVQYQNGALSLIGYRLPDRIFAPGETLTVDFYWRAESWLPSDFGMAALVLSYPDGQPVVKKDIAFVDPPPESWLPGFIYKMPVTMTLPSTLSTPSALMIATSTWRRESESFFTLAFTQSDVPSLTPEIVVLKRIAVISGENLSTPPAQIKIDFDARFNLVGYSLPAEVDGILEMAFWWDSSGPVDHDLVQLFHLIPMTGEDHLIFDRLPFDGRLPTDSWNQGMHVLDSWSVPIPDTAAAGSYRVVTGMYNYQTGVRTRAIDAAGHRLRDDLVELGTVLIN